ncbi:MAG TPA: phage tail protein [Candidatus Binatia bacterium]|jgi:phage tail-like protein
MDANGTKFHLLLGRGDWSSAKPGAGEWARQTSRPLRSLAQIWESRAKDAQMREQPDEDADVAGLRWDSERDELTLATRLFQFAPAPKDRPPELSDRRGSDRDRYGNWYWIAESEEEILVNSAGTGTTSHFWSAVDCAPSESEFEFGAFSPAEPAPKLSALRFRGLAVTEDHYLVAGVLKPSGLLIFDLHAGGGPLQMLWPEEVGFTPFDFAARPGGGVWLLDRDPNNPAKTPRYWALDRRFNVEMGNASAEALAEMERDLFQPLTGGEPRKAPRQVSAQGVTLEAASPLAALDAIAIEALPDGTVLILDRNGSNGFSSIYHFDFTTQLSGPVSTEAMCDLIEKEDSSEASFVVTKKTLAALTANSVPHDVVQGLKSIQGRKVAGGKKFLELVRTTIGDEATATFESLFLQHARWKFTLIGHDFAFVSKQPSRDGELFGALYVVEEQGNQTFAFNVSREGGQLKLDPRPAYFPMRLFGGKGLVAAGDQAYYDFDDRWIPLVEQPRPRYQLNATLETRKLDGGEPDCRWHRLMLDACIPPETGVEVWSRAANEKREVAFAEWRPEPRPYRRGDGSEQPFAPKGGPSAGASTADYATWELLLQHARGRFIQVKLRLSGNGRTTPRLRAMRIYYPRFSYLAHYLPAVYREEGQSASFLDRFLANIEGFYTAIEDKIAAAETLFDVRSVPREYLEWLAGWFGVTLDPSWDDAKRRLFIRHAVDFFQYRGTIHGLKAALRLALERCADESVFDVQRTFNRRHDTIRIVENYRARRTPGIALGDSTMMEASAGLGLAQVSRSAGWRPQNGRSDLYRRYAEFLRARFSADGLPSVVAFSLRHPVWQQLTGSSSAAQTPVAESNDAVLWRAFLKKRYPTIAEVNEAHATKFTDFAAVTPAESLPPASAALADWNAFVAEKSAAWRDFATQELGFVPQSLGGERSLWRDFLAGRYGDIARVELENAPLPYDAPTQGAPREDWDEFRRATAGTSASVMRARWQDFLARRYRTVGALNDAYGTHWTGFDDISLFDELPLHEAAVADWYRFESVVVRMQAAAHRFTVLLPVPKRRDQAEFNRQRELATRIVNWEKPAHTVFDVKFYWAMFRVGAARLGYDTLLDVGSRAPELMIPMVLDQGYLAESYLADDRDLARRQILGRGRLRQPKQVEAAAES